MDWVSVTAMSDVVVIIGRSPTQTTKTSADVRRLYSDVRCWHNGEPVIAHFRHLRDWSFWRQAPCHRSYQSQYTLLLFIMRPSSLGGGRIMRRTLSVRPSVCLSVCLFVRPVIVTERHVAPPSELQWHTCTFRHTLRAAYRTAISAAEILVKMYT